MPLLLPNELVLGFFGAQAAHGRWSLGLLIAVATLGDILGTVGLFLIARKISIAAIERFGGKIGIKHERIASLELKLRRWEMAGVFVGRTIPFVRIYTSLAAAVLRMPFWEFFVPAVGGAIVWASLFLLVGFFLRELSLNIFRLTSDNSYFWCSCLGWLLCFYDGSDATTTLW